MFNVIQYGNDGVGQQPIEGVRKMTTVVYVTDVGVHYTDREPVGEDETCVVFSSGYFKHVSS